MDPSSRALFGRRLSDVTLARLAGALPGSRVRVLAGPEHDTLTRMYFNLNPRSQSRKALAAALKRKGIAWASL